MPYIWAVRNLPADWWAGHTVTDDANDKEIVRVYGTNPTSVRYHDGSIRHAQAGDYVTIRPRSPERKPV